MRETAYAKVNLALHVRGRMVGGYHRIETVFAFCEGGDVLTVDEGEGLSLAVTGPFADGLAGDEENLVLRAARALLARCGRTGGARLTLDKRLPVAAGIGGGSADAAAALRLLDRWWDLGLGASELLEIAAGLGADVPACLLSRVARGEGRGDSLEPLEAPELANTPILLVNPGAPLSTTEVFRAWDGIDRGPLRGWREGRNDLEPPATRLAPQIGEVLAALRSTADLVRMSGSGATCFALYHRESDRDSAARRIAAEQPRWWMLPSRLRYCTSPADSGSQELPASRPV